MIVCVSINVSLSLSVCVLRCMDVCAARRKRRRRFFIRQSMKRDVEEAGRRRSQSQDHQQGRATTSDNPHTQYSCSRIPRLAAPLCPNVHLNKKKTNCLLLPRELSLVSEKYHKTIGLIFSRGIKIMWARRNNRVKIQNNQRIVHLHLVKMLSLINTFA